LSSKARRPYLMGKKSVTQFYQAPVRYLKELVGKESKFEKPYVDEEYRKMHFDFPWPDWPPFPPISPWPPLPPIEGPVPGLPGCAIVCYGPLDCDEPIWCHPSIWCGQDLDCTLCTWEVKGATTGFTAHRTGGAWGIDVWIDSELVEADGAALIRVCMTDPCGNVCCSEESVSCKICPPEVAVNWASGDLTIGQSSSVGVSIADGLGPYSWSVAGTGFSMLHEETAGVSNTLQSDETACGPATITVTDFCDGTATGYVRCTADSHWVSKEGCYPCPAACSRNVCATCDPLDNIVAGYRQWVMVGQYEYSTDDDDCPPWWGDFMCTTPSTNPPPCGSPGACGGGVTCNDNRQCMAYSAFYQEWECV